MNGSPGYATARSSAVASGHVMSTLNAMKKRAARACVRSTVAIIGLSVHDSHPPLRRPLRRAARFGRFGAESRARFAGGVALVLGAGRGGARRGGGRSAGARRAVRARLPAVAPGHL